tara:strand:+ start:5082 stop:5369 length:288 start_codon:yes stop_codon:yes gene_type:complete
MNSVDYDTINKLIDEIVGGSTMAGASLKKAIKNYFDTKPIIVKFPKEGNQKSYNLKSSFGKWDEASNKALERHYKKVKQDLDKLKKKGEYCGING